MSAGLVYRPGRYTIEDWEALRRELGPRMELLNGDMIVDEAPSLSHQDIAFELAIVLRAAIALSQRGELRTYMEINVMVGRNVLIPDIAVVRGPFANELVALAERVELAVEVVSPDSRRRDRVAKPAAYARAGINFYWRVEPDAPGGTTLITHRLAGSGEGARYVEDQSIVAGTRAAVGASPVPVELDPAGLLPY